MDFQSQANLQTFGGGLQPTATSTGGDLFATAGNLLTSGLLSTVLGAIKNLSNIGASTNPTKEMNSFLGHIKPRLEAQMASITKANAGAVLTDIDQELMFNYNGYKHLLDHHARANSTKEAYRVVMAKCLELRAAVHKYITGLKSGGATIIQTTKSGDFNSLEPKIPFADGRKFDSNHKYTVTSNVYKVTVPADKPITQPVVNNPVVNNPIVNNPVVNNPVETDVEQPIYEEEVEQQQAGSGGIFGMLLIGYFLYMFFKRKK